MFLYMNQYLSCKILQKNGLKSNEFFRLISDTKKNLKDYMAITLRSGKELQVIKEAEKRQTDSEVERKNQNQACNEKGQEKTLLKYERQ